MERKHRLLHVNVYKGTIQHIRIRSFHQQKQDICTYLGRGGEVVFYFD